MNTINHLQSAFTECLSYTRYHPSKGYSWEFNSKDVEDKSKKKVEKPKEEPSSVFQRVRVDILLAELSKKYAPRAAITQQPEAPSTKPPPARMMTNYNRLLHYSLELLTVLKPNIQCDHNLCFGYCSRGRTFHYQNGGERKRRNSDEARESK